MSTHALVAPAGSTLAVMQLSTFTEGYLETHRYTPASRATGRKILARFTLETGDPEPHDLTEDMVLRWWKAVSSKGAAASLRAYHSTVRCFLEWLRLPSDLLAGIRRPKEPRTNPRVLTSAEVDRLRMACGNMRDRTIIELAWGVGLRCLEITLLQPSDIDWDTLTLSVHSKGGHVDELPFPERAALAVDAYYRVSPPLPSGFVVRNLYHANRGITTTRVTGIVAEIGYRAGVKKAAFDGRGAHGLRRTFATDLLDSGVNIRDIQSLMRHETLSSTEKYLRRSTTEDLRRAINQRRTEPTP